MIGVGVHLLPPRLVREPGQATLIRLCLRLFSSSWKHNPKHGCKLTSSKASPHRQSSFFFLALWVLDWAGERGSDVPVRVAQYSNPMRLFAGLESVNSSVKDMKTSRLRRVEENANGSGLSQIWFSFLVHPLCAPCHAFVLMVNLSRRCRMRE